MMCSITHLIDPIFLPRVFNMYKNIMITVFYILMTFKYYSMGSGFGAVV
jgi:hypothetical protein